LESSTPPDTYKRALSQHSSSPLHEEYKEIITESER